jgi:hypothetical protein
MLRSPQIGDVAVLDVSATKIDKDESNVQNIPAAESKGLPLCSSSCFFFFFPVIIIFGDVAIPIRNHA